MAYCIFHFKLFKYAATFAVQDRKQPGILLPFRADRGLPSALQAGRMWGMRSTEYIRIYQQASRGSTNANYPMAVDSQLITVLN